ncbi:protein lifeguard 3-like isoform X3 [Panulirus ornatus]|uniref:protein lifeguard 3-like isoform X3 n=2 Tax=Panulirus ornatus TaxID=150431 RepID=UPI003A8518D7
MQWTRHQVSETYPTVPKMSAPYPVDPKSAGVPSSGWAMPSAPAPNQGYPVQPGYAGGPGYPTQPAPAFSSEPPPYSAQPGFVGHPNVYVQPGQPVPGMYPPGGTHLGQPQQGGWQQQWGGAQTPYVTAQPVYNASSGGFPVQDGNRGDGLPKEEVLPDQFGGSFSDKAIRHAFIRKVYLILMVQLLFTLCIVSLFTFHSGVRMFVRRHIWVYFVSYAVFLVTYLTLVCCSGVRRRWPGNFIMLAIFTLALSYMAGTIASAYETTIVIMTVGITCAICLLITLFATQTKYDFTGCGIYLFVAAMVMFLFGIIAIFTYSRIMYTIYSAGIALLFSMYLVFDTQMIVGGRKHEMSPEEHIFGALVLYLDVINIFLALLSLFGGRD